MPVPRITARATFASALSAGLPKAKVVKLKNQNIAGHPMSITGRYSTAACGEIRHPCSIARCHRVEATGLSGGRATRVYPGGLHTSSTMNSDTTESTRLDKTLAYQLEGYGSNGTQYYGTSYSAVGSPRPKNACCQETDDTFKVFLTGGGACCDPDNIKTDAVICASSLSRFEGSVGRLHRCLEGRWKERGCPRMIRSTPPDYSRRGLRDSLPRNWHYHQWRYLIEECSATPRERRRTPNATHRGRRLRDRKRLLQQAARCGRGDTRRGLR